jgi:hypothetical protein
MTNNRIFNGHSRAINNFQKSTNKKQKQKLSFFIEKGNNNGKSPVSSRTFIILCLGICFHLSFESLKKRRKRKEQTKIQIKND